MVHSHVLSIFSVTFASGESLERGTCLLTAVMGHAQVRCMSAEEPLTSLISFHRNKRKVRNIPFARHCLDLIGWLRILCEGGEESYPWILRL